MFHRGRVSVSKASIVQMYSENIAQSTLHRIAASCPRRGHFSYGDTKACWFVYAHPCKKSKVMKTISFADCWPCSVTHLKGGRTEAAFSSFIRVKTSLQSVSSRMLQALSIQFLTQWLWAIVLHVYGGGRLCLQRGMNFGFGTQQVKAELPIRSNDHSSDFLI